VVAGGPQALAAARGLGEPVSLIGIPGQDQDAFAGKQNREADQDP